MTLKELIEYSVRRMKLLPHKPTFEPVGFYINFDGVSDYTGAYGIAQVELPFDNDDQLLLVCDYCGGGAAHPIVVFDGLDESDLLSAIHKIIVGAVYVADGFILNLDDEVYVESGCDYV